MNDPKWLLTCVIEKLSADQCKELLAHAPQAVVASIVESMPFSSIPADIVCMILSFTPRKDTRAMMLVCKHWYEQTKKPLFWGSRINEAKRALCLKYSNFKFKASVDSFDTFACPVKETLQDQLQWVWRLDYISFCQHSGSKSISAMRRMYRRTARRTVYEEQRVDADNSLYLSAAFASDTTAYSKNLVFVLASDAVLGAQRIEMDRFEDNVVKRIVHTSEFGLFDGQGIDVDTDAEWRKYVPHGNGKWTFKDGSVLEGEMVACKGKPRYIAAMAAEAQEPEQKKRKH
jgi:hypothetical protein